MIDLIYDCDITMGLPGRDVDDGLALLHLLGCPEIRLLGITTTFGNSSIQEVHPCLLSVLEDLGRGDIPAYSGASRKAAATRNSAQDRVEARTDSKAARFLAEAAAGNPGKVSILATGSPTNLLGAFRIHPGFFRDVKQIVFMGGITESLMINGREMGELNFASDPEAALYALYAGRPPDRAGAAAAPGPPSPSLSDEAERCPITVVSGNLCLQALLSREHFAAFVERVRGRLSRDFIAYLLEKIDPWFSWINSMYGLPGFHAWDATAAVYLTDPGLFESAEVVLRSTLDDLRRGYLRIRGSHEAPSDDSGHAGSSSAGSAVAGDRRPWRINLPTRIRDLPGYWRTLFGCWEAAGSTWPQ
jgi:inosine-uridine nucleoside N-ribohydrolase